MVYIMVFSNGPISLIVSDTVVAGQRIVLGLPGFLSGCDVFEGKINVTLEIDYQFDFDPATPPTWELFTDSLWVCVQELITVYSPSSLVLCGDSMGLALAFLLAEKVRDDLSVTIVGRRVPFFGALRPQVMEIMDPVISQWATKFPKLKERIPQLPADSDKALALYVAAPKSNVLENQVQAFSGMLVLVQVPFDSLHPQVAWDYLLELMPGTTVVENFDEAMSLV